MRSNKQQKTMEIYSIGKKDTNKDKERDMIGYKIFKLCKQLLKKNYQAIKIPKY